MDSSQEVKVSFVIGNGPSRSRFDLTKLADHGVTYGCNLLIEDTPVDNLVAVDHQILIHLVSQGYDHKTNLWSRPKWTNIVESAAKELPVPLKSETCKWDKPLHWSSGSYAVNLAAQQNANIIVMLGFDLWPQINKSSNIYADKSPFYKNKSISPDCLIYQVHKTMKNYPHISFVQIQPTKWKDPILWAQQENYSRDSYHGLREWLKNL